MIYKAEKIQLSVIVPCFNEINTIDEVIKIKNSEIKSKEIIIVDDGSSSSKFNEIK